MRGLMGARRGVGKSRPSPTPLENHIKKILYMGGRFATFYFCVSLFCYVFLLMGTIFTMWGPFHYFFLHLRGLFCLFFGGGLSWACPHSLRKFLRASMCGLCGAQLPFLQSGITGTVIEVRDSSTSMPFVHAC